jgi:hypothetical protein
MAGEPQWPDRPRKLRVGPLSPLWASRAHGDFATVDTHAGTLAYNTKVAGVILGPGSSWVPMNWHQLPSNSVVDVSVSFLVGAALMLLLFGALLVVGS